MEKNMLFFLVDVFSEASFSGNQLAVVVDDGRLECDTMQCIAREFNFSETTFVKPAAGEAGGFAVRIFTPQAEVPFAGHPSLGTAWVIRNYLLDSPVDSLVIDLAGGSVLINFDEDQVWMHQKCVQFGDTPDSGAVAAALGLGAGDLDGRGPVMVASTGLPTIIVPVATLNALKNASVRRHLYDKIIAGLEAKLLLLFCAEAYRPQSSFAVRVFADYFGVPEDPATGSAAGALGGYLAHYGYRTPGDGDIILDQGWEIGRPSRIVVRLEDGGGAKVGGQVRLFATGSLVN